eukprot:1881874-Rhodomonas_salina.1
MAAAPTTPLDLLSRAPSSQSTPRTQRSKPGTRSLSYRTRYDSTGAGWLAMCRWMFERCLRAVGLESCGMRVEEGEKAVWMMSVLEF